MTEDNNIRQIWSDAELDAALADLHGDARPGSETDLSFARATLLSAAGAELETRPAPAKKRVSSWRWIAVAAAVVTVTGGLAVAVEVGSPTGPDVGAYSGPAITLSELDRPLAPGEFHYAKRSAWLPQIVADGRTTVYREETVELWIPADPGGRWHRRWTRTGNLRGELLPQERATLDLAPKVADEFGQAGLFPGRPPAGTLKPNSGTPFVNWTTPDAQFLASLVPDMGQLTKRLLADTLDTKRPVRENTPTESLGMVRSVLEVGLLHKDVRVALCQALAKLPGIAAVEGRTSPNGQPATAFIAKDSTDVLYVDAATSQPIAASTASSWPSTLSADLLPGTPVSTPVQSTPVTPTSTSRIAPPPSAGTSEPHLTKTSKPNTLTLTRADVTYTFSITRTAG